MPRTAPHRQGFLAAARAWLRRFAAGDSAAVATVVALSLPVLAGVTALAVDGGVWYADARRDQEAAEAVAFSAAANYATNQSLPQAYAVGYAVAAQYGLANGQSGNAWTINIPSASGPNAGVSGSVEAIIHRPENFAFAGLFINAANSSGRAVAMKGGGNYCILALDTSSTTTQLTSTYPGATVYVENGSKISAPACGLAVNGPGANALTVTGGSTVDTLSESIVGSTNVNNGSSITNAAKTYQAAVADPYASVPNPTPGACTTATTNVNMNSYNSTVITYYPGTYCGSFKLNNDGGPGFILSPGIYYIDGGCFCLSDATVTGTGVTIVLTGGDSNSPTYANMSIDNNTFLTLSAMTTGYTTGLVFYADRRSPTTTVTDFGANSGGGSLNITGAVYLPSQQLHLGNGVPLGSATCTQVIAWDILITGGVTYNTKCSNATTGIGTTAIGGTSKIVE